MKFVEIDGSQGEGGGQILRTALSLSCVFGTPVRIANIRRNRSVPGLRPQHLQSALASAKLCNAKLIGGSVGSTAVEFVPGNPAESFQGTFDSGTAGSISLIAQTVIPIAIFHRINLDVILRGGTEVPNSPTIDYIQRVVLPVYKQMCKIDIEIVQRGYYPKGGGVVRLRCSDSKVGEFAMPKAAKSGRVSVLSVSRSLPSHVSARQLESAKKVFSERNFEIVSAETDHEGSSLSPGSSVLAYLVSESSLVGTSSLGERGKKSESVGEEAARNFLSESESSPNVDQHLADMLLTTCCVTGNSKFTTSAITDHFKTNAEIATKISGCKIDYHKVGSIWQVSVSSSSEKPNR